MLALPASVKHVTIRGVVADPKYHAVIKGAHERGIHGGEVANVGLRRCRGAFMSPKASDTYLSPQAIAMIARQDLQPDTMYRMDRHDVVVEDSSIWNLDDDALLAALEKLPSTRLSYIEPLPHWHLRDLHTNACGDFLLMGSGIWHLVRGVPYDRTILALDADSLIMHAAAAFGVKECRWPEECKIYKPAHGYMNNSRITPVWKGWQYHFDAFLRNRISINLAHWVRMRLDYPRRRVRGVESVLGPSTERNFARRAQRWARGVYPIPTQPETWGLSDQGLEERVLCRASWDDVQSVPKAA